MQYLNLYLQIKAFNINFNASLNKLGIRKKNENKMYKNKIKIKQC